MGFKITVLKSVYVVAYAYVALLTAEHKAGDVCGWAMGHVMGAQVDYIS